MLEVISSVLKRELEIIQYLYKNRGPQTIEGLMEIVEVTEKTIRNDIDRINKNYPLLCIERGTKSQVTINCADDVGLEYVYRKIMESSIEFDFLESLLMNPNCSIKYYVETLFVSESFIRQLVHKWNNAFKRRGLDISISTAQVVKVEGDEVFIRQVFSQYLVEKYSGDFQHKFKKINGAWELMRFIGKNLAIDIPYSTHLKLSYWILVCAQRRKNGYYIKRDTDRQYENKVIELLYHKISENHLFTKQFMRDYQVSLSLEFLMDSLDIFDYDLIILKRFRERVPSYKKNKETLPIVALKDFLQSFYRSIHYEITLTENMLAMIYSSMIFPFQINYFFYNSFGEFKEYIKTENPLFVKTFESQLRQSAFPDYLKENSDWKDELLYHTIIHSKLLVEKLPKLIGCKKLLILTTFHNDYENLLKEKIENEFTETVDVSLYRSDELNFDINYIKKFDLIITNYDSIPEELEKQILYLDICASTELFERIESKLIWR